VLERLDYILCALPNMGPAVKLLSAQCDFFYAYMMRMLVYVCVVWSMVSM
jgi:hypothetical protein